MKFTFTLKNSLKVGDEIWLQHTSNINLFKDIDSSARVELYKVDEAQSSSRTRIKKDQRLHNDWIIRPLVLMIKEDIDQGKRLEVEIPSHKLRASTNLQEDFQFFVYTSG